MSLFGSVQSKYVCIKDQLEQDPIDVVQNQYDDLGLSQTVGTDGSEWTRTVSQDLGIEQSYSDFYGESVVSSLPLISEALDDVLRVVSAASSLSFVQATTIAGGRIGESSSFTVTYNTGGPAAEAGQIVYIDGSEAKLASIGGIAEVAGFLSNNAVAGSTVQVLTEGKIDKNDWTNVAGTALLTPGAIYYLHTGGEMRVSAPTGDEPVVVVGRAITTTEFDVEVNPPWE